MAIAVILSVGFIFTGCDMEDSGNGIDPPDPLEGEILILSAYGGFHVDGPTHNFVELYNPGDKEINLGNCTLQYAAYNDDEGEWVAIPLTGTIKPKHSYLILGEYVNDVGFGNPRIRIEDGSGDVNDEFRLHNRGFRIALIRGNNVLTVDNPFRINEAGAKVPGYIDFIGSRNDLNNELIGWKGPPNLENTLENFPRNSNQEGIRRRNLTNTDSGVTDFTSVRYTVARSVIYPHGVNDNELEIYKPKNRAHGAWDPFEGIEGWKPEITYTVAQTGGTEGTVTTTGILFTFSSVIDNLNVTPADITLGGAASKGSATFTKSGDNWLLSPVTVNDAGIVIVSISKTGIEAAAKNVTVYMEGAASLEVKAGEQDALAGKLLILQAYAPSGSPAGLSHPFVELYNTTNAAINLTGITLFFANGNTGTTQDDAWRKIALTGTIPAGGSFLIMGPKAATTTSTKVVFEDNYGDINDDNFTLSNNAYKIAIIRTNFDNALNVQNPFTMDKTDGSRAAGYIDMVGAHNTPGTNTINGFEIAPARGSASEAIRRKNLIDTDNNQGVSSAYPDGTGDFDSIRYGSGGTAPFAQLSDALIELRRPRNSANTTAGWDPFAVP